jgi:hypothetical protein
MARGISSRFSQIRSTFAHTWADMDYAQRRLFEIRTGTGRADIERARDRAMLVERQARWRM